MRASLAVATLSLVLALAACGQKGPLYRPTAVPAKPQPTAPAPAPASQQGDQHVEASRR